ncbi:hypothetical protein H6A12_07515 [Phocea massiliensis]|uniref:Lipoprotein n=1 Tax=Merdimmobilis hominis TaxID=2897707 RepID=A0A939BEV0_9FIRM|nr:hypothetical protein [Merdimmobilis hominis]MBM6920998.1 hypothetical protein [Merdimmobilis hominis]
MKRKMAVLLAAVMACAMTLCACSDDKVPLAEFVESPKMNEELQDICKAAGENVNVVAYAEGKELKIEMTMPNATDDERRAAFDNAIETYPFSMLGRYLLSTVTEYEPTILVSMELSSSELQKRYVR